MTITEINKVCFVGSGVMGCYNSLLAALAGYQCVLYDVNADTLATATARLREIGGFLVGMGLCDQPQLDTALSGIELSDQLTAATSGAELISESIFERLESKREIHRQLDVLCPPSTLITTNTSGFLVSEIEDVLHHGQRFAALHSHLGAMLFDIVGGPRTSEHSKSILRRYVVSLGGTPLVLKKENSGYVLNTTLGSVLTMAMLLRLQGHPVADIDRAWMKHLGAPIGAFGLMDMFGLDVVRDSWDKKQDCDLEPHREKVVPFLTSFTGAGQLGMKSGSGFYRYPDPAYQAADFLALNGDDRELHHNLLSALIQKAIIIADQGVADPADIDLAWTVATDIPRGPFALLQQFGVDNFARLLDQQADSELFVADNIDGVRRYLRRAEAAAS